MINHAGPQLSGTQAKPEFAIPEADSTFSFRTGRSGPKPHTLVPPKHPGDRC